ncbi:hypothetical protein [Thermococcus celericrescens]|nr:hypothetical protein [Thermococcus celericrescens]
MGCDMDDDLKAIIPFIIIFILIVQMVQMRLEIGELRRDVEGFKNQHEQYSHVLWSEYGRDIYAAREYLQKTRPDIMERLGNASLTVDSISTWSFEASYDPEEGVFWVWYRPYGQTERSIVYVQITAYYPNGTPVRGFPWMRYKVNHTTGEVIGVSADTADMEVMRAYNRLYRNVTASLGIPDNRILKTCRHPVELLSDNETWFDFEMECVSTENISLCWFIIGEVDGKTGILRRLEITRPFEGGCENEDELRTLDTIEKLAPYNATAQEIKRNILNLTGGLMFNLTFPNP